MEAKEIVRLGNGVGFGYPNRKQDVELVQALLNTHRPYGKRIAVDGVFGPETRGAIIQFQKEKTSLTQADGWIGPEGPTFRRLLEVSQAGAAQKPGVQEILDAVGVGAPNRPADVKNIQSLLNRHLPEGIRKLVVDGISGPRTEQSIIWFQKQHVNLPAPDGRVDPSGPTIELLVKPPQLIVQNTLFSPADTSTSSSARQIAWGKKVGLEFKRKVIEISGRLGVSADYLMACMAFETGETFSPSIKNAAGSGATGLIQFMPSTARGLNTSTDDLSKMTAVEQLDYVERYFTPYKKRLQTLEDVYLVILYPAAIGMDPSSELFKKGTIAYQQNIGLDKNKDGAVTPAEISVIVRQKYNKGLKQGYIG